MDRTRAMPGDDDRRLLETRTGRAEPDEREPSPIRDEIEEKTDRSRPVSDRTNVHLSGTGAVETDDGLDEAAEALRRATEEVEDHDVPNGDVDREDRAEWRADAIDDEEVERIGGPVFDRGEKI